MIAVSHDIEDLSQVSDLMELLLTCMCPFLGEVLAAGKKVLALNPDNWWLSTVSVEISQNFTW